MPQFVLAHLSDVHLTPPARAWGASDLFTKRLFSRLSWTRARRFEHRPEVLDSIVSDLRAQAPDHVAITGDLTNFAAADEIAAARSWLERLGPARDVTVSLGNHDCLVQVSPGAATQWLDWLGDGLSRPEFPAVRERDGVALVNACSSLPTRAFSAEGELGATQLERLRTVLSQLGAQGRFRILLIHHPVAQGVVSRRKALRDAAALREMLAETGAELVLHGHGHEAAVSAVAGPHGPIPVLGIPSASAAPGHRHAPARWRRIEIDTSADAPVVMVTERGYEEGEEGVRDLGSYRLAIPRRPPAA